MSKKSLLIAAVLIFLLIATAMAVENKNAADSFQSRDYLDTKSIESTTVAYRGEIDESFEQNNPARWSSFFMRLQPISGDGSNL